MPYSAWDDDADGGVGRDEGGGATRPRAVEDGELPEADVIRRTENRGDARKSAPNAWSLDRRDQATVVVLIGVAGALLLWWCVAHWWRGAALVELERVAPRTVRRRVDPNRATWAELSVLPRVGEEMARAIVAYRESNGPFLCLEDLTGVTGIGDKTAARLAPYLVFEPVDDVDSPGDIQSVERGPGETVVDASPSGPSLLRTATFGQVVSETLGSAGSAMDAAPDDRIDVNTASSEELQRLPGVGPVLAGRIIERRESIGGFLRMEELLDVSGIGEKTLEKLLPLATVSKER